MMLQRERRFLICVGCVGMLALASVVLGCDSNSLGGTAPPNAPILAVSSGNKSATLMWSAPADGTAAEGYRVYRAEGNDALALITSEALSKETLAYTDEELTNGSEYRYSVRSVSSNGAESNDSNIRLATPLAPPNAPILTVSSGNATAMLMWSAPAEGTAVAGYRIYRTARNGVRVLITSEALSKETLTYTDEELTNGSEYRYSVRSVNNNGAESNDSNIRLATPLAPPDAPVFTVSSGNGSVALTWTAPADGIAVEGYRIYRASGNDELALITSKVLSKETLAYTDGELTNGTIYRYSVRSVNNNGTESNDSYIRLVTPLVMSMPMQSSGGPVFDKENLVLEKIITIDAVPYGMATIPGTKQIFVTSRNYRTTSDEPILLLLKDDVQVKSFTLRIPGRTVYYDTGGGFSGVFDVAVDPNYATNNYVYLFLTLHDKSNRAYANQAILRLTYNPTTMEIGTVSDANIILEDTKRSSVGIANTNSNGGALLFLPDDTLLATFGYQHILSSPQTMSSLGGKIVRLFSDGRPVCGNIGTVTPNPFCRADFGTNPTPTPQDYVYSMGHKNNQGMTLARGRVLVSEHGERGGDEINLVTAGGNYGFPYFCNGCRPYGGRAFGNSYPLTDAQRERITSDFIFPAYTWIGGERAIAPSGAAFYTRNGPYKNNLIVASLIGHVVYRFFVDRNFNLIPVEPVIIGRRFREVMITDDGAIYISAQSAPAPGQFVHKFRPVR